MCSKLTKKNHELNTAQTFFRASDRKPLQSRRLDKSAKKTSDRSMGETRRNFPNKRS